ncbi:hypothetical protein VNO80_14620 [Phaseolus coccineus]|uniref:Leishmanolysin-like peptidase n=1 Tax=Phaseolus coccineus TaxID=3886 RepID=A0AAN9MI98_PHACN
MATTPTVTLMLLFVIPMMLCDSVSFSAVIYLLFVIALGQIADWFRRVWSVEPVKGNLRLSGYSACGQDGGVQVPHAYVEESLARAVACERDQWGRAIAGHVNVAPRHLTAEAETLLSATPIHEVMHVLGFDPHAFAHFGDETSNREAKQCSMV